MHLPEFLSKVDVTPIVRGHLDTLVNARTGKPTFAERMFFFGLPLILGLALCVLRFAFRLDAVNGFLNSFAILTGLLLNLLVLVFSLSATAERSQVVRRQILKEVFTNVCYCILLAIGVVSTALVDLGYMKSVNGASTGPTSTFLLSALTMHFVISLLMVMKRMFKLISSEFDIAAATNKKAA